MKPSRNYFSTIRLKSRRVCFSLRAHWVRILLVSVVLCCAVELYRTWFFLRAIRYPLLSKPYLFKGSKLLWSARTRFRFHFISLGSPILQPPPSPPSTGITPETRARRSTEWNEEGFVLISLVTTSREEEQQGDVMTEGDGQTKEYNYVQYVVPSSTHYNTFLNTY
jgi:hypothetical protein